MSVNSRHPWISALLNLQSRNAFSSHRRAKQRVSKTRAALEPTPLGQTKQNTRELIQLQTESSFDENAISHWRIGVTPSFPLIIESGN
jgi:hypothetical protein